MFIESLLLAGIFYSNSLASRELFFKNSPSFAYREAGAYAHLSWGVSSEEKFDEEEKKFLLQYLKMFAPLISELTEYYVPEAISLGLHPHELRSGATLAVIDVLRMRGFSTYELDERVAAGIVQYIDYRLRLAREDLLRQAEEKNKQETHKSKLDAYTDALRAIMKEFGDLRKYHVRHAEIMSIGMESIIAAMVSFDEKKHVDLDLFVHQSIRRGIKKRLLVNA